MGAGVSVPRDGETVWSVHRGGPVAALLEDAQGLVRDVNEAFCQWTGQSRERLVGQPVSMLVPEDDRPFLEVTHRAARDALIAGTAVPPVDRRLIDSEAGVRRWCRVHLERLETKSGEAALLWLLLDIGAEQRAQVQAERAMQELGQWFELSPAGQVVFDAGGLILRSNIAFESLIEAAPVSLTDMPVELQRLLGWHDGQLRADLRAELPVIETQCELTMPDARVLRLFGRLRAHVAEDGIYRVLALVLDRSAEVERDLARLEMGALMSAAGVGVATFDASGCSSEDAGTRVHEAGLALPAALQGVDATMIDAAFLPAYQRLQAALSEGRSAEVRYAIQHPQLGHRWLLTRVEPARLRSGRPATSVVTLDVTEQEESRLLGDELLRELTTILDASPVGIAYLRAGRLVRCNRRFERMLGFEPGAAAGADFEQLFEWRAVDRPTVAAAVQAVRAGLACDVEVPIASTADGSQEWIALSVRRAESIDAGAEAVAVLSDITGLKRQQAEIERALHERELMFDQSDVGIAWVRGGRILRTNPAMSDLTGFEPQALAELTLSTLYAGTAADKLALERTRRQAVMAEGRFSAEMAMLRRDGQSRWMQVAVRAVAPQDPRSDWICTFVDVDERRRAREALQQQAARTRAMLDSVLVGIVTVGEDGIEWMNRSARRMFAGELATFLGEPIGTVATDEPDHPLARPNWLQRLSEGQSETFECRLKARDGRAFWVVGNAVATPADPDGKRQITFVLLDIEARRQAEVRVSGARASLQRLIETAPLAIALFDAQSWRVVECNQAAEAFFGQPAAQLHGCTPDACFADPEEAAALQASLRMAHDTVEGVRREITRPGPAGGHAQRWDTRFVHLDVPSDASVAGRQGQILLVANDVTEQRQAEQARLDAAIAQREMLVKEVHHRIKNNLQGVAGLLQQTAERRPALRTELLEAIGQVQAIAQVYGLQVGAAGPLGLAGVLGAIAASIQRSRQHIIEVRVHGDAARWILPESESIPLALTLNELLTNAVKHGTDDTVRCAMHMREDDVLIEIVNGGRLPPDFNLRNAPSGMYGLGLVRALLPRRAASLEMVERQGHVVTSLVIRSPSVRRVT